VTGIPASATPRPLVEGLLFPEGPRWYDGRFWFSDIHAHRVYAVTPDGMTETVARLDDRPSGIGFLPDGTPLVVSMLDRCLRRIEPDGTTRVHADVSHLCDAFINDMVVDGTGRAYVGCRNGGAPGTDAVLLVEPDGLVGTALPQMTSPNGTVITPDGRTLILAETHVGRLAKYRIKEDGALIERSVFTEVPGTSPDGICLDEDGMVWIGGGAGLLRMAEGRGVVAEVALDLAPFHVVACALGGPDRRTMLLAIAHTTAQTFEYVGLDRTRDATTDARGWVGVVDVGVAGAGWP
jgi:sugar lactone lactonase YvrE